MEKRRMPRAMYEMVIEVKRPTIKCCGRECDEERRFEQSNGDRTASGGRTEERERKQEVGR